MGDTGDTGDMGDAGDMPPSTEALATVPKLLIIETSGRAGVVALAHGSKLLAERRLDEARRHARDLAPQVAELLKEQAWTARQLNGVIVSRGPGSYTGLRVGIMSAKALAYATSCKLFGIDTFNAVALQVPSEVQCTDVLADAQQGRVYLQRFRCSPGALPQIITPLRITSLQEWLQARPPDCYASGPGLHVYGEAIRDRVIDKSLWDPKPASLLHLGLARWAAGEGDELWQVEPLYLRPSAAEEKWAANRGNGKTGC